MIAGADSTIQRFGWGAGFSGDFHLPTGSKDAILWQVTGGKGIGRFANNEGVGPGDFVIGPEGSIGIISQHDVTLGIIHYWTDQLRTNVDYEYIYFIYPRNQFAGVDGPGTPFGDQNRILQGGHANLIWSPITAVDIGAEYIYVNRKAESGQRGIQHRAQFSTKFRF